MRNFLPNHHKFRRRLERRLKKTSSEKMVTTVYTGRRKNPFRRTTDRFSLRTKIESVFLALICIVLVWFITSYSFFQIQNVHITGLRRINETEVRDVVQNIFHRTIWFVFPGTSYVFVDVDEVRDILKARFPLQTVLVEKTFPHTISITIEEKLSTVIYDNETQYSYLGLDGQVVDIVRPVDEREWRVYTKVTTTTLADGTVRRSEEDVKKIHVPPSEILEKTLGPYPILYDKRKKPVKLNTQVVESHIVEQVIAWYELIHSRSTIPLSYITLEDVPGMFGTIVTDESWIIKFSFSDDPVDAFERLETALKDIPRPRFEYIDLRYPNMVYWK